MTVNSKMTTLADQIRELSGSVDKLDIDAMISDIGAANTEILRQAELLTQIITVLESKTGGEAVEERLEGDGQEFYTTAPSTLSFRSTAPLNELQDVQINGQTVDPTNYELEEGSTIVNLKHDYLSTLNVGKHELSVVSSSKTVNGDFTVMAPELNEYGFYYNQPYYIEEAYVGGGEGSAGSWGGDGGNTTVLSGAFIISTNNTVHILNTQADTLDEVTSTCENNIYTFDFGGATLTGSFTSNGASFVTSKVFITGGGWMPDYSGNDRVEFTLSTEDVCSDDEYIYYCSSIGNVLVALPLNDNKSSYNLPKIHIRDNAVTGFAHAAFSYNTQLTSLDFMPEGLTRVSTMMCDNCTSLTSVTIPESVINIDDYAFRDCVSLKNISFEGTMTQWNNITKGDSWNLNAPATYVQCSDGQVSL